MKRLLIGVIFLSLAGGGVYWAKSKNSGKQKDRNVRTVTVERTTLQEAIEATGVVQPQNRVEIKPPVAGRIEKLIVDEGDLVKAGQILGWLSSTDRAAIMDAARAKGDAEVKRWDDAYKPTPIIAPLSGTIILRNVVVGQTIDSSTIIFAMSDKLIVKADVDESDIGRVRQGMPATITLDSYPTQPIQGEVFQILHEGVNVSNVITYPVKILPKELPPFFRSQMTANIKLIVTHKENVLVLPPQAISSTSSGDKNVQVPGPDGKAVSRVVETGLENNDGVEIVSGLSEGDKVFIASKRYVPQQAAGSSPLVMQGNRGNQQSGQSGGQRRRGTN